MPPKLKDGRRMVHIAVEPELQKLIADYRFAHHFPTKTATWKWLARAAIQAGLKPTPQEIAEMEDGRQTVEKDQ